MKIDEREKWVKWDWIIENFWKERIRWLVYEGNSRHIISRWPVYVFSSAADSLTANTMAEPTRPSSSSSSSTITTTLTRQNPSPSQLQQQQTTLVLRLNRRKKVAWKDGTVDNEFLHRKSSKKCCIFHKQKPFDEDDSDDDDHHRHHDHGCRKSDGGDQSGEAGSNGCGDLWLVDWFRFGSVASVKLNLFTYICIQIVFWMWRGKLFRFSGKVGKLGFVDSK